MPRDGIVGASKKYTDLSSFIEDIKNQGMLSTNELGLIMAVGDNLTAIKNFRNCIMHSRAYNDDDISSFDKARSTLEELLLGFQKGDGRQLSQIV